MQHVIFHFCLQYCFLSLAVLFLAQLCDFMNPLYHYLSFHGSGLIYTYIYKYIFILTRHTLQWSCFFNGLSSLKEHKVIIYISNVAAKRSSEISHCRFYARNLGELILRRAYVLLNSFNQSSFNVCTLWAAENSGRRTSFSLGEILVMFALKLILSYVFYVSTSWCWQWYELVRYGVADFSHCQNTERCLNNWKSNSSMISNSLITLSHFLEFHILVFISW